MSKKRVNVHVGTIEDMSKRFIHAWKRAERGEKVREEHLTFSSLEALLSALSPKRLELLRELVPMATEVAVLFNPKSPEAETVSRDVEAAAHGIGLQTHVLTATSESDIDAAFTSLVLKTDRCSCCRKR